MFIFGSFICVLFKYPIYELVANSADSISSSSSTSNNNGQMKSVAESNMTTEFNDNLAGLNFVTFAFLFFLGGLGFSVFFLFVAFIFYCLNIKLHRIHVNQENSTIIVQSPSRLSFVSDSRAEAPPEYEFPPNYNDVIKMNIDETLITLPLPKDSESNIFELKKPPQILING